jgi:hypothetical protein
MNYHIEKHDMFIILDALTLYRDLNQAQEPAFSKDIQLLINNLEEIMNNG